MDTTTMLYAGIALALAMLCVVGGYMIRGDVTAEELDDVESEAFSAGFLAGQAHTAPLCVHCTADRPYGDPS